MEWNEVVIIVLGSSVVASGVAAGISSWFNLKNSKEQRESEEKKLYFEKALEAYEAFSSPFIKSIHHYFNQAALIDNVLYATTLTEIKSNEDMEGLASQVMEILKKNVELDAVHSNASLKIFINTDSCKGENWETLPTVFDTVLKVLITGLHGETTMEIVTANLTTYSNTCKALANMYAEYIRKLQNEFATQMKVQITL